jgi:RNA polymerase sigma-70 factor (ECF subfamily)
MTDDEPAGLAGSGKAGVLERAKAGDEAAFRELMDVYQRQVINTAWRLLGRLDDAQDAGQEVFLRLFRSLRKIPSEDAIRPWLYRVTVNVCRSARKRSARRPAPLEVAYDPPSGACGPEEAAETAQRMRWMMRALARLPEKERTALVLREIEGLSTKEVAEILDSSETTVRSQISVARTKLRKMASGEGRE